MFDCDFCKWVIGILLVLTTAGVQLPAQTPQRTGAPVSSPQAVATPTRANILRGEYGAFRANNDLLFYHLDVRVDPLKKFLSGKNTIRFRMLRDDTRIQLDLAAALNIDKILFGTTPLKYEREAGAVFVVFPRLSRRAASTRLISTIRAVQSRRAGLAASPSEKIRPVIIGLTPPAREKARASGGPTKINGATKLRTCESAWRFQTA